jgi:hypothetical protein
MIDALMNLATNFGLSASAGLNAYIPLLVVALTARFTDWIKLKPPFDNLTNEWIIAALIVLLAIEMLADKIPVVDTVNDIVQTVVRPTAGAILFAASSNVVSDIHPVLALLCGILVAGGVHAVKATARPVITATTAGTANPFVSTAEDVVAAITSILAIVVPIVVAIAFIVAIVLLLLLLRSRTRRRAAT